MDMRSCCDLKVVIYWPATVEAWVQFQARPHALHSGQSGAGTDFSFEYCVFCLSASFYLFAILIHLSVTNVL
jgi:hypothetical protein